MLFVFINFGDDYLLQNVQNLPLKFLREITFLLAARLYAPIFMNFSTKNFEKNKFQKAVHPELIFE